MIVFFFLTVAYDILHTIIVKRKVTTIEKCLKDETCLRSSRRGHTLILSSRSSSLPNTSFVFSPHRLINPVVCVKGGWMDYPSRRTLKH
jgi:hypothetical protein